MARRLGALIHPGRARAADVRPAAITSATIGSATITSATISLATISLALIGPAVIGLALARLGRLLQPPLTEGFGATSLPWPVLMIIAILAAAGIGWAASSLGATGWAVAALQTLGMALFGIWVMAGPTLLLGLIPTSEALVVVRQQISIATEVIRYGAAPVLPVPGLVALLAGLFWVTGALGAAGIIRRRPVLAAGPGLILYLQFATLDRLPPGLGWPLAFATLAAVALYSMAAGFDPGRGRVRATDGRVIVRRSGGLAVTVLATAVATALLATSALAAFVPESGLVAWRSRSGLGAGLYGSGSFNLFVGLQQSLVDLSDDPMFYARVSESAPPNQQLYWRLITLDTFDGNNWLPGTQTFARGGSLRWERDDWRFRGPTTRVAARVRIAGLNGQYLPTLYSPVGLASDEPLVAQSFRVREDGSIAVDLQATDGWEYELTSDVPLPNVAAMASVGGELSPIFEAAAESGAFGMAPIDETLQEPPDGIASYLALPESIDTAVQDLASQVTERGATDYERALLLVSFFRDSEQFAYSTEVSTGHTALDLEEWLIDPDSRNYRTGYCEQFATAMAVMGRLLGIPSRVVLGFTPGETAVQPDGTEVLVVRERNAHAWIELWMDDQGWVRFDPTPRADGVNPSSESGTVGFEVEDIVPAASQPSPRAGSVGALPTPRDIGEEVLRTFIPRGNGGVGGSGWWIALGVIPAASVVGIVIFKGVRRRNRIHRLTEGDVAAAWEEIIDRLSDLGGNVEPALTPLEIARDEDPALVPLALLYGSAVYGGIRQVECLEDFSAAEASLRRRYQGRRWWRSWLALGSLKRRS